MQLVDAAQEKFAAKRWDDAADLWSQVVINNPVSGAFWVQLGVACYHAERYRDAVPALERALELGGGFPAIDFEYGFPWRLAHDLARCHARLWEKDRALDWLKRALEMGYRDRAGIDADESFTALRGDPAFAELRGIPDVSLMTRDEGWRADLTFLTEEVKRLHYDPYRVGSPQAFDDLVRELYDDIPRLSDVQIVLGVMRLMSRLGDGHSLVDGWDGPEFEDAPLDLFLFEEGLFVTAASPAYADLVGAQVVGVGNHNVDEVMAALEPLVSRDNDMWLKLIVPHLVRKPHVLHALGLTVQPDRLPLTLRDARGQTSKAEMPCAGALSRPLPDDWPTVSKQEGELPRWLRDDGPYWFEHLADEKAVYIQHRSVSEKDDDSFEAFVGHLFEVVEQQDIMKLILDLRRNGGGNTLLLEPLVKGLMRSKKVNRRGHLFVIVGRHTFSAAMNEATLLERFTEAIFVGEPTGSSPNFVGETVYVTPPYSKLKVSISDLYWQTSWPSDQRRWLAPSIYVPPTFATYRENRDPALETVLAY
jgi:hypothetical protein